MKKQIYLRLLLFFTTIVVMVMAFNFGCGPGPGRFSPKQETDQVKEQIFKEAKEALQKAQAEDVPLLSPKNFARANQFYQKALKDYEKRESLKKIRENLKRTMDHIEAAFEASKISRVVLEGLIQMRGETIALEIPKYAADAFSKAEQKFREVAIKIEDGDVKSAKSIARDAEKEYRELTIEVLKNGMLADARKKLKDAKDTIPKESFRKAKAGLDKIENFIKDQKGTEFAIGELFTEVDTQIKQALTIAGIGAKIRPSYVFFEQVPAWRMPDLAVTSLVINSDRTDPGSLITFRSSVVNVGGGSTKAAELRFLVDDVEFSRSPVEPLNPGSAVEIEASMTAHAPGRHNVVVELVINEDSIDYTFDNNRQMGIVRVSGEEHPLPELELRPDFDPLEAIPGEPFTFIVKARNPSFADITSIPISLLIDGELLDTKLVENLSPGEIRRIAFNSWDQAEAGRHIVEFCPQQGDDPNLQLFQFSILTLDCIIPYMPKQLYSTMQKDKWVSIGPGGGPGIGYGSVGRIDVIAFDPKDPSTMYAGAPKGGLWRSSVGGVTWHPLTDGLPTLVNGAVAVDPQNPKIVYWGTGYLGAGEDGVGIFKSNDSGVHWYPFAIYVDLPSNHNTPIKRVAKLVVRYPTLGQVLIYAATDIGLLRYTSTNPLHVKSDSSDWTRIKTGEILNLSVNPANNSEIYVSILDGGLWRTTKGESALGDIDWQEILSRPASAKGQFKFDVFWKNPKTIWAALNQPGGAWAVYSLLIFKNVNDAKNWTCPYGFDMDGLYNAFIRVHPSDPDKIYFGGVKLYWCQGDCGDDAWEIGGIHVDQKDFQWDPTDSDVFYVTNDGGVFRCEWDGDDYNCEARNFNLRVTQFYDFDASQTNPNLMIGGTQDNGTIIFTGDPYLWKEIKGGDGYYSLIAPGDKIFYAQHQYLAQHGIDEGTSRCEYGANCDHGDWKKASDGLPTGDQWYLERAQIVKNPFFDDILYSVGDQVYLTSNKGESWTGIGPLASDGLNDVITRVAIHPKLGLVFAGTDKGQIWVRSAGKPFVILPKWHKIFERSPSCPIKSMAFSPVDPDILYVTFNGGAEALRIFQLHFYPSSLSATDIPITANFPASSRMASVIAGDGHKVHVAYVGTDKGVFRGEAACEGCPWTWKNYSDGLPMVEVNDLLVDPKSKELRAATFGRGTWSVITAP